MGMFRWGMRTAAATTVKPASRIQVVGSRLHVVVAATSERVSRTSRADVAAKRPCKRARNQKTTAATDNAEAASNLKLRQILR